MPTSRCQTTGDRQRATAARFPRRPAQTCLLLLLLPDYSHTINHVSSIRLFILGTLSAGGPLHGHQIRQQAQSDRTELWTDINVGSVYGALKRLANEGLVREVRTERVGNRPERTIYEITPDGRRALAAVRQQALRDLDRHYDSFDLALAQSRDIPKEELEQMVTNRLAGLQVEVAKIRQHAQSADPYVNEAERMVMQHLLQRAEAEVRWHTELAARLPKVAEDFRNGIGGPQQDHPQTGKESSA
jgi:DNA-binding PadR family transcriptional regulator